MKETNEYRSTVIKPLSVDWIKLGTYQEKFPDNFYFLKEGESITGRVCC